ncbi:GD20353 [Drosophila simulans]|uniref:GD20353 n=1 Tax=Drosophila simulans TaxID=7240 RepID=B4QYH8_DROSI|nr:GD20353 [Drosophila simulans]
MSNDVQVARVAKIATDVPRRNGKQRDSSGFQGKHSGSAAGEDFEYVFGSISPRGGGPGGRHLVGSSDLDSPEHTQRDTTESDNNISSCSTLDIVNKVSNGARTERNNQVSNQKNQYPN